MSPLKEKVKNQKVGIIACGTNIDIGDFYNLVSWNSPTPTHPTKFLFNEETIGEYKFRDNPGTLLMNPDLKNLVVEDSELQLQICMAQLNKLGFENVSGAANGNKAYA